MSGAPRCSNLMPSMVLQGNFIFTPFSPLFCSTGDCYTSNTVITLEEWVIMHIPLVAACGDYAHTYGLPVGGHPVRLHLRKCTEHQFSEVQTSSRKANKIKDGCRMVMHVLGRRSKEERALSEKTKKTMLGQSMLAIVHFSLTVGSSLMFMEAKLYTTKKRGC